MTPTPPPTMTALVFDEARGLRLETDRPTPTPAPGEVLLAVRRAGVCATDLEIVKGMCGGAGRGRRDGVLKNSLPKTLFPGYVPGFSGVLGHEAVADVCAVGPGVDAAAWVGARVVPEINAPPPTATPPPRDASPAARAAFRNHCPDRTVLGIIARDGVMAQYAAVPAACCVRVPPSLPDDAAVFVEPLAAAFRILEQGLIPPSSSVAVVGDGRLGLLTAGVVVAAAGCARFAHLGRHADKLALVAGDHERVLVPRACADAAVAWAAGRGGLTAAFDVVVDATGAAAGAALALALVRPLGTLVLKTTVAPGAPDAPDWGRLASDVVVNEKRVVGSRCGPYAPAVAALEDATHPLRALVAAMVTAEVGLEDAVGALARAGERGVVKVVVRMK